MQRRTLLALSLASAAVLALAGGAASGLPQVVIEDSPLKSSSDFKQKESDANENNDLLRRGAVKLGIPVASIARNVKGCWNLGSCGLGCPTNARQSMLVTTIPAALDLGAQLLTETRAERFELANGKVTALMCRNVETNRAFTQYGWAQVAIKIIAKHCVLAGGAINSPAVLLRSGAPDPHGRLGVRTFLHPVVMSSSIFAQNGRDVALA